MWMQLDEAWLDGLKIHDVDDLLWPYQLRAVDRKAAPRSSRSSRPRRQGGVVRTKYRDAQILTLVGYVDGDTASATQGYFDALRAMLDPEAGARVFKFRRRGFAEDEQVEVVAESDVEAPQEGYQAQVRYTVTVVGPDPRIFAAALKTGHYDPTIAGTAGLDLPLDFPLVFGGVVTSYLEVENQGNAPTPPVYTITGPGSFIGIDNDVTGDTIGLAANLAAGDIVTIDVATRRVELNGAYAPELIVSSLTNWAELPVGQSRLRLRAAAGMVGGQTDLAVSFRDARR